MVKYCLIFCFLLQGILVSKADTLQVFGTIHDTDNPFVHVNYYVVNKRVGKGIFGNSQGKFSMLCKYSDTIAISADGYYTIRLTLRDSVRKGEKNLRLRVGLRKKEVVLQTVSIVPQRDIQRIKEELDRIKDPSEIKLVNVSALESPLTALYQAFSKIERSKYKVAVMEAEDRKKDILKELLSKYVRADILSLNEDQFDAFINTGNFNLAIIKTFNDYELIMHVMNEYEKFKGSYQYFLKQD